MAEIAITRGYVAIVDDEDLDWLSQWSWSFRPAQGRAVGYACRGVKEGGRQREISMHRMILGFGGAPCVDHINGYGLDNRRANLRFASRSENAINSVRAPGRSGFRGVFRERSGRWFAHIRTEGRVRRLGTFDTPEEAAVVYDAAARVLHGSFAVLNFPEGGGPCS